MTERVHNLKQTSCPFQVRGIISGVESDRFYKSGVGKNGGQWNKINFGVKINENKTVYISLNGFPRQEVYYYKRAETRGAKGTTVKVPWKDRKKSPGDGFRLIGVNLSTGKDNEGNNINSVFTEYDAVEWLHENLKDGESVFIKGNIEFSSYVNKDGNVQRRVDMVLNQMSYTKKPVDFDVDDFTETCDFDDEFVFSAIDKETDENDKPTGRFILSGYAIGYNTVENISFIIPADHAGLANNIRKSLKPGNFIKVVGKVDVVGNIEEVVVDDGWGEQSKINRNNGSFRTEYIVVGADPHSIDKETYSEDDIAAAIKKIKASKEAERNFGEQIENDDVDAPWDDDGGFDDDPWD